MLFSDLADCLKIKGTTYKNIYLAGGTTETDITITHNLNISGNYYVMGSLVNIGSDSSNVIWAQRCNGISFTISSCLTNSFVVHIRANKTIDYDAYIGFYGILLNT